MIEVDGLKKSFGPILAVDGISFSVKQGEVLGFLGPNGAGKSTTMRMLSCFLAPDSGSGSVAGHDILEEPVEVKRNLGYLAENAPAYDEMTPQALLDFVCDARGMTEEERIPAIEDIAKTCAITSVMYQPIGTLSKGFRRRVGLAQAMIHNPPVLILDEPTDGLDPNQKHDVRKLIRKLATEKCIIVSTHILEEVDAICDRIVIISQGKILEDTTPDELRNREGGTLDEIFRKLTTQQPPKADEQEKEDES